MRPRPLLVVCLAPLLLIAAEDGSGVPPGVAVLSHKELTADGPAAAAAIRLAFAGTASYGLLIVKDIPGFREARHRAFNRTIQLASQPPPQSLRPRSTWPGLRHHEHVDDPLQGAFLHNLLEDVGPARVDPVFGKTPWPDAGFKSDVVGLNHLIWNVTLAVLAGSDRLVEEEAMAAGTAPPQTPLGDVLQSSDFLYSLMKVYRHEFSRGDDLFDDLQDGVLDDLPDSRDTWQGKKSRRLPRGSDDLDASSGRDHVDASPRNVSGGGADEFPMASGGGGNGNGGDVVQAVDALLADGQHAASSLGKPAVDSAAVGPVVQSPVAPSPVASSPVAPSPVASSPVASSPVASSPVAPSAASASSMCLASAPATQLSSMRTHSASSRAPRDELSSMRTHSASSRATQQTTVGESVYGLESVAGEARATQVSATQPPATTSLRSTGAPRPDGAPPPDGTPRQDEPFWLPWHIDPNTISTLTGDSFFDFSSAETVHFQYPPSGLGLLAMNALGEWRA